MRIRDENNSDPGWKKGESGINIPDPAALDSGDFCFPQLLSLNRVAFPAFDFFLNLSVSYLS
jgi:hypothetical protein